MFDWLVGSVLGFGAEIWGWKELGEIERVQEKYLRWVLRVEWKTPGYMVREESKKDKMRLRMGRRAVRYEEKIRGERGRASEREDARKRSKREKGREHRCGKNKGRAFIGREECRRSW